MEKTTLYLPADLKRAVTRLAQRLGQSEAEVIRAALRSATGGERPRPRAGLFHSGEPIASDVDAHLQGFGER